MTSSYLHVALVQDDVISHADDVMVPEGAWVHEAVFADAAAHGPVEEHGQIGAVDEGEHEAEDHIVVQRVGGGVCGNTERVLKGALMRSSERGYELGYLNRDSWR